MLLNLRLIGANLCVVGYRTWTRAHLTSDITTWQACQGARRPDVCWRMLTYADVCRRAKELADLTYADVCWRMLTYADVCRRAKELADLYQGLTLPKLVSRVCVCASGVRQSASVCVSEWGDERENEREREREREEDINVVNDKF
jgi:hypothetical protein